MQALPLSASEIILGAAALISTMLNWRFSASSAGNRLIIKQEIEALRRDIATGFMPQTLAAEQRSSMIDRMEDLEKEYQLLRERYHKQANEITEKLFKQNSAFVESLIDHSSKFNEKMLSRLMQFEDTLRVLERRVEVVERRRD